MAIFNKKEEIKSPETKRLSEIVFQMLVENVPEEQIVINLQQLGLDESRAHQVLSKAKQEFENFIEKKLEVSVERIVNEKLDEAEEKKRRQREFQIGLKFDEQKTYTDKSRREVMDEVGHLKSDFTSLRLGVESEMKLVDKTVKLLKMSGSTQKMLSVALLLAGVFGIASAIYLSYDTIQYFLSRQPLNAGIFLGWFVIILLLGAYLVAFQTGFRIYSMGRVHFEKLGADFIREKRREEEKSIQALVRDEDVV